MNVTQAAEALGSTKTAVRKAIARGTLAATKQPAVQAGPFDFAYDITPEEVERYRADHRTPRKVKS